MAEHPIKINIVPEGSKEGSLASMVPPNAPGRISSTARLQQMAAQARSQRAAQMSNLVPGSSSGSNSNSNSSAGGQGLPSHLLVGAFPVSGLSQRMDAPGAGPRRQKTRLEPGHSAMDWESLKKKNASNTKMRGNIDPSSFPLRVSRDELKRHNTRGDCWVSLGSKVYDITTYLNFHPGGSDILIKTSGRDATEIFNKYHRWVNFERILDGCLVGFLV